MLKPYTKLVDGDVLFVNLGSVGKPKDGDWRACSADTAVAAARHIEEAKTIAVLVSGCFLQLVDFAAFVGKV